MYDFFKKGTSEQDLKGWKERELGKMVEMKHYQCAMVVVVARKSHKFNVCVKCESIDVFFGCK